MTNLTIVWSGLTAIETTSESTSAAIGCSMSSLSPKSSQVSVKTAKSTLSSAASSNSYRSAEDATKSGTSLSDLEEQQQQDCAACASSQTELKDSATNSTTTTTTSVLRHSGTCSQSVETASTTIPTVSKASSKHSEQANGDLCSPAIASKFWNAYLYFKLRKSINLIPKSSCLQGSLLYCLKSILFSASLTCYSSNLFQNSLLNLWLVKTSREISWIYFTKKNVQF